MAEEPLKLLACGTTPAQELSQSKPHLPCSMQRRAKTATCTDLPPITGHLLLMNLQPGLLQPLHSTLRRELRATEFAHELGPVSAPQSSQADRFCLERPCHPHDSLVISTELPKRSWAREVMSRMDCLTNSIAQVWAAERRSKEGSSPRAGGLYIEFKVSKVWLVDLLTLPQFRAEVARAKRSLVAASPGPLPSSMSCGILAALPALFFRRSSRSSWAFRRFLARAASRSTSVLTCVSKSGHHESGGLRCQASEGLLLF